MSGHNLPSMTLTFDGVDYVAEFAKCDSFTLEVEDHGFFTAFVSFAGPGWGQGLGARALDEYDEARKERVGCAFGMDFVMECVRVLGTPQPKLDVPIIVLRRKSEGYGTLIAGFARVHRDGTFGDPFFPDALAERHYPPKAVAS